MHFLFHNLHGLGVSGFSAQDLSRLQFSCWLSCVLFWSSVSSSENHVAVGRTQFLVVKGLRPPFSCQLVPFRIPKSHSRFLSSQAPSQHGGLFCQGQQEKSLKLRVPWLKEDFLLKGSPKEMALLIH